MTSIMAPSYAAAQKYGPLLTQLGASKLDTSDPFVLRLEYTNNSYAVNAAAALVDSVLGAKLVVDNRSNPADLKPTSEGLTSLLQRVPDVQLTKTGGGWGGHTLSVFSTVRDTAEGLRALLRPEPAVTDDFITLSVFHSLQP